MKKITVTKSLNNEQASKYEIEPEINSSVSGSGQNKENQELKTFEKEVIKGEKSPKKHYSRIELVDKGNIVKKLKV